MLEKHTTREGKNMRRQLRTYTLEFKKQAITLAAELNSVTMAANKLGISPVNIYDWKKKLEPELSSEAKKPEQIDAAEREELLRLRKEVSELKKVNHILKSAAAFFSQDHLK
jgi:transposase